jgi:hypothetical protein
MSFKDVNECGIGLLADVAITDLSSVAQTTLYTVPTGKVLFLFAAMLRAAADVGANLAFTIGKVGALTDFIGTTNGDNLDAAGDGIWILPVPSATPATIKTYAAGTVIQLDVTVAGNAVAGRLFLFGMLYDA